jgi:DNA modification methylase
MRELPINQIVVGDVRQVLDTLPEASIATIVTSPPYFRLRNYGHDQQIGLERSVDQWVDELRLVARGLRRVLKPSGSLWLNLGDTFSRHPLDGATPKSLVLGPERLAVALVADGWVLRNKVIWAKTNPMPTSVKDRLSCTWEVVYFFTRERHYSFDLDAIRVPHTSTRGSNRRGRTKSPTDRAKAWSVPEAWRGPSSGSNGGLDHFKSMGLPGHPLGKNPGDVWNIATAGYRGAHHAVYPIALAERPILATCPPGGVVLDPFMGSGTTAVAAERHGRQWVGIEINPEIAEGAMRRVAFERVRRSSTLTTGEASKAA